MIVTLMLAVLLSLLNYFDAKIYTKYNENAPRYFDLKNLPKDIDVTNDGTNDIQVDKLKFLSVKRGPSLFADDGSQVWFQFESSLSTIEHLSSSDIEPIDEVTICIQFNFGSTLAGYLDLDTPLCRFGYHEVTICIQFNFGSTLAGYLDLDTPLCRFGYHSPSGEAMPDDASVTHIFKPNIIPGLFFNNANVESTEPEAKVVPHWEKQI